VRCYEHSTKPFHSVAYEVLETQQNAVWIQGRIGNLCLLPIAKESLPKVNTITQTPINIGPAPRVIRCDDHLGLVALLIVLGSLAWIRRNELRP